MKINSICLDINKSLFYILVKYAGKYFRCKQMHVFFDYLLVKTKTLGTFYKQHSSGRPLTIIISKAN